MPPANANARVQCADCHNILVGSASEALNWTHCPACNSPRLVMAQALAVAGFAPAMPGDQLAAWQAQQQGQSGQPLPTRQSAPAVPPYGRPEPHSAVVPPAPGRPAPLGRRPAPAGPRGQNRAVAQAPKPSKSLIVVRLLVTFGALAIAAGVLIVWMLTKDAPQQPIPEDAQKPLTNAPVAKAPPEQAKAEPTGPDRGRLKAASAPFIGKIDNWADMLRQRSKGFGEAYQGLVEAHLDWRQRQLGAATQAYAEHALSEARAMADGNDARQRRDQAKKAIAAAKGEQPPVARFVFALVAMDELPKRVEEAKTEAAAAEAAAELAVEAHREAAGAVYEAESAESRQKLWEQAEALRMKAAKASSDRVAAERKLADLRSQLSTARSEADKAAEQLPNETAEGKQLRAAWAEYVKATAGVRDAQKAIEDTEEQVSSAAQRIANAQSDFATKEAKYKEVHAELLKVSKAKSEAESRYQANGGDYYKRQIDTLAKSETDWKEKDKNAKNAMNEARKTVADLTAEKRKAERELPKLKEALEAARKTADGGSKKFAATLAPVKTRVITEEAKRVALIEKLEAELAAAVADMAASEDAVARHREGQEEATRERQKLEELKDALEVWDRHVLKDPLPEEMKHLASRLEALKKLDYLTLAEVRGVLVRAYALEQAIERLQEVTDPPEFGNRLRNALGNPMDKWRATAGKTLTLMSEIRADAEALSTSLWGARNE